MVAPLLPTKVMPPPLPPDLVVRSQLLARLMSGGPRALTLITAPPGYGKTTLVRAWMHQLGLPAAWLALDAQDNDPARFLNGLVVAFQSLDAQLGQAVLGQLQSLGSQEPEALLLPLLHDLATLPTPTLLVLDDYHVIDHPSIHQLLGSLLAQLPPQLHLVLSTRADPPFPLGRLRAYGRMVELRVADLRFTPTEAATFFHHTMSLCLTEADVQTLMDRTEGWIAALQLAALSLQRAPDPHAFIAAFVGNDRYVVDYLVEEVLAHQPQEVQRFLLVTAILDQLTGDLCNAVLAAAESVADGATVRVESAAATQSSDQMLATLVRQQVFVLPMDQRHNWYRYHHLFAAVLRDRLQTLHPELVPCLHRAASQWYTHHNLIEPAVSHALAARDWENAAKLIAQHGTMVVEQGAIATLLSWIDALPTAVVTATPLLQLLHAWALALAGQADAAARCLDVLEREANGGLPLELQGQLMAVHALTARLQGDMANTIQFSRSALAHLPPDKTALRHTLQAQLATAYDLSGNRTQAAAVLAEITRSRSAAYDLPTRLSLLCDLGRFGLVQGRLHQAHQHFTTAQDLARTMPEAPTPLRCIIEVGLGYLWHEWNDLHTAAVHLETGVMLARKLDQVVPLVVGATTLARVRQAQGDERGALKALQYAEEVAERVALPERLADRLTGTRVVLWLKQGHHVAAAHWAAAHQELLTAAPDYAHEEAMIALARVRLSGHDLDGVSEMLAQRVRQAEADGQIRGAIWALVVYAQVRQAQGQHNAAHRLLAQALAHAAPEGYVRTFIDEGAPMKALLTEMLAQDVAPTYVRALLAAFPVSPHVALSTEPTPPALLEPLTTRERTILRLLAAGHSSPEIAAELVVAVSTVRTHLKSLYGKLEAHSRHEAISRGRALGLLP